MAVTEVTKENWFGRIIDSIKGIGVGLLLFLVAFPILFWNEGRAVKTARSLAEGASSVISIAADRVDGALEGKLVHFGGLATTTETLADTMFGVALPAIKLEREVEMYQWRQNERTETRKKTGGGEEKITTYTYEKVWDDDLIKSDGFKETGHVNPASMPYTGQSQVASLVTVGSFKLSPGLIGQIDQWEDLRVDQGNVERAAAEVKVGALLHDGQYYLGANPTSPAIGDTRVSFRVVKPTTVSVVAKQVGVQLEPYQTLQRGYDIELLELGVLSADQMFAAAESRNSTLTWVLRLVGFAMQFMGLFMIGRPFAVVADFIPFIGGIFRVGVGIFAFLVSFATSMMTIAIAWIFYRPILGILLLSFAALAIVGLVVLAITVARRRKAQPA